MKLPIDFVKVERIRHAEAGRVARTERLLAGLTLREVAKRMGHVPSYICDLENGRRGWSAKLAAKFNKAIKS